MKTTFTPIDYSYFDFQGKNHALVIGRNQENKKVCIIDSCPIYLWAILKKNISDKKIKKLTKKIQKIKIEKTGRKTKVEKVEIHKKNFLGKKVKALKIFVPNYKDLHSIANKLDFKEIEKRRGYDLGFTTHYIIEKKLEPLKQYEIQGEMLNNSNEFGGIDKILEADFVINLESFKGIKSKKIHPKILAYDIETDEIKVGEGEILMISLVSENLKKVLTWKKTKTKKEYVEFVKDEKQLLEKFCEIVKKQSPDILTGYFSDGFDMPYIKERAKKLKIELPLGIDKSQPKTSSGINPSSRIKGIVHIDLLKFIKTAYSQYMKSETLSLNEVSKEFLGDTKKDFKIKHSSKLLSSKWEDYYEYNLHDSVLTLKLFEKFWPDMLEFSKIIKEPLFEISRNGLSKQIESYILHNLKKYNEIPERRPNHDEITERRSKGSVQGAFVYEPKPGLYKNLAMFDFTSMHTSIIISYNLSKSTIINKKELKSENKTNKKTKEKYYISPEINLGNKKVQYYFSKEPGFFPSLMKELYEKRKKYKKEYKKYPDIITKARSNAFKLLSASAHGYVGFFGARYYSWETSATILAFVRKFNKEIIEKIKNQKHEVIMGDTDSVAFTTNKKSKKEILELLEKLNLKLPGVMHLELEDFFKKGIWVTARGKTTGAKKKYALIDEKEQIKIRGFETVRRDWCKLARDTQNKVIELILKNENEKKALEYLKKIIKKLKKREINKEEIIIKTQLKKPLSEYKAISPHVLAAQKMKENKIPISQGGLVEYYVAETKTRKKLVREKVKLPQEKGEYNIEYYLKKQILPAVENIFQVFKINITEVIDGKKQMTLGDF